MYKMIYWRTLCNGDSVKLVYYGFSKDIINKIRNLVNGYDEYEIAFIIELNFSFSTLKKCLKNTWDILDEKVKK
jgi:hypothetical protein